MVMTMGVMGVLIMNWISKLARAYLILLPTLRWLLLAIVIAGT